MTVLPVWSPPGCVDQKSHSSNTRVFAELRRLIADYPLMCQLAALELSSGDADEAVNWTTLFEFAIGDAPEIASVVGVAATRGELS
jgi:hypothetical protein